MDVCIHAEMPSASQSGPKTTWLDGHKKEKLEEKGVVRCTNIKLTRVLAVQHHFHHIFFFPSIFQERQELQDSERGRKRREVAKMARP